MAQRRDGRFQHPETRSACHHDLEESSPDTRGSAGHMCRQQGGGLRGMKPRKAKGPLLRRPSVGIPLPNLVRFLTQSCVISQISRYRRLRSRRSERRFSAIRAVLITRFFARSARSAEMRALLAFTAAFVLFFLTRAWYSHSAADDRFRFTLARCWGQSVGRITPRPSTDGLDPDTCTRAGGRPQRH